MQPSWVPIEINSPKFRRNHQLLPQQTTEDIWDSTSKKLIKKYQEEKFVREIKIEREEIEEQKQKVKKILSIKWEQIKFSVNDLTDPPLK